jgi:hypothetical protein
VAMLGALMTLRRQSLPVKIIVSYDEAMSCV